ncbi:MAG: hypothetical protein RBR35_15565, partial [Salinivirgaceae bacterium]|nr:hypothetical protein [Salinivirgaceae bacterium]
MEKQLKLLIVLLLGLWTASANAQESNVTSGGEAIGSGGTVSYSVGQVIYSTNESTTGSVAAGVQQPYEISVVVGIDNAASITCSFVAYPNPTQGMVTIKANDFPYETITYKVFDSNGRLLENGEFDTPKKHID